MLQNFRPVPRSAGERARYRRQYAMLLELDDYLMHDVGVRRVEFRGRMAGQDALA